MPDDVWTRIAKEADRAAAESNWRLSIPPERMAAEFALRYPDRERQAWAYRRMLAWARRQEESDAG